jgi:cbb3-type cytochrome oxidase maturation protein
MDILYILVPLGVLVTFASGWLFWRASEDGQFEALDAQGPAILDDDDGGRS